MSPPGTASPWLRKYIFPGAYSPALSEVFAVVEQNQLWVTDLEFLRLHYAKTLNHWHRRFEANREKIAAMYDERFCRMFEFYLISAETMFTPEVSWCSTCNWRASATRSPSCATTSPMCSANTRRKRPSASRCWSLRGR